MENHGNEMILMLLSHFKVAFAAFIQGLLALFLVVLVDTSMLILTAYAMIALHVFSGWVIMCKGRTGWNKEKWFKTCMKLFWFPLVIVSTEMLKQTHGIDVPIAVFVSGFLCVNEIRGFINNVGRLTGVDIWNAIADQIDWKKFKVKK